MSGAWELVREVGLEYAAQAAPGAVDLACPVAVERVPGLGLLIVDDLSADGDPLRMRSRTRVIGPDGSTIYDSQAQGLEDAYGCALDAGRMALLCGDRSELLVISLAGERLGRIDVAPISPHPPRLLAATHRGTLLIAFLGAIQEIAFAEIDPSGTVLWSLAATHPAIGIPGSLQLLRDDALLVADEFHSVVWKLGRDGVAAVRWGRFHHPSDAPGDLHRPRCARELDDGTLLVADAHNHRVLSIGPDGTARRIRPEGGEFLSPAFATRTAEGNYLICDAGNRGVVEVESAGRVVRTVGAGLVRHRHFSFPRSVEYRGDGRYLIADSAHNRIVDADRRGLRTLEASGAGELFWPRAASVTPDGGVLVADGRNGRVLELAPDGRLRRSLAGARFPGRDIAFRDPHDARLLPGGRLLVVDSTQHLVLETDWDGRAAWVLGGDADAAIRDPHSAEAMPDGRILISDPGNHRIAFVDPHSGAQAFVAELRSPEGVFRLKSPRYAGLAADGTLVIVDTGNSRVLVTDLGRTFVWELARIPGSPLPWLRFPRWAHAISRGEIVVSDYHNHRIVHLRRQEA